MEEQKTDTDAVGQDCGGEQCSRLSGYVVEHNSPEEQIQKLEDIFDRMRKEPLPGSREEFEKLRAAFSLLK